VAENPIENLLPEYSWAKLKIAEFHYRKLFGLTKEEMDKELWEDFYVNREISKAIAEKEEAEIEMAKRRTNG